MCIRQRKEGRTRPRGWGVRDEAGRRQAGIVGVTVAALRAVGLLDEIVPTREGLVVYPTDLKSCLIFF